VSRGSRWAGELRNGPARPPEGRLADLFAAACLAMVPLTIGAQLLLPARFSYDSDVIQRIAAGEYNPLEDTSYLYVGRLYGLLGTAERPWLTTVIGIGLAMVTLYAAMVRARGTATPPVYALIGLYTVTASVFLGVYSKDVWVLLVALAVLLAPPTRQGEAVVLASIAVYATFLREYWWLILAVYLGLRALTARRLYRRWVLVGVVGVVVGVTVLAPAVLGVEIQDIRETVNQGRELSPDASTAISAPEVGFGVAGDVVENLALLGALVVPVPLLTLGSLHYALYFAAILMVWVMFARSVFVGRHRVLDGGPTANADPRTLRAALLVLAVLTTQGFFEPDYGSYLRHLTPVLPLVIAVVVSRPGSVFMIGDDRSGATRDDGTVRWRRSGLDRTGEGG
jgi:hypothetical protein